MPRFSLKILLVVALLLPSLSPLATQAALTPYLQAVVRVDCAGRQGSGSIINGDAGYVLTAAHVAIEIRSKTPATSCRVGLIELENGAPTYFYRASIVKYTFDESKNRDYAILKIEDPIGDFVIPKPFPMLQTNEFAVLHEPLSLYGFPFGGQQLFSRTGTIEKFEHGIIQTDAEISPGDSGGAALDQGDRLIGVPTRIVTTTNGDNTYTVTYELQDIRSVMTWLDTYGINDHDRYFAHQDYTRYHQNAVFVQDSDLDCEYVARTQLSSTVYCLMNNGERLIFPNDPTFSSWFPNFDEVILATPASIIEYPLNRNVTYKPGSLVKLRTAPSVYVVVDSFGTLRWVPTEEKAKELWGSGWASLVKDIPDEFWTNYTVGQPLEL